MKAVLVNYNFDPVWLLNYPDLEPLIYDRSDDNVQRELTKYGSVIRTENKGNVDRDKLSYLIENYDSLPEIFLWGKTNIFKYVSEESFAIALRNQKFAPLLKYDHRTYADKYGVVAKYVDGMYHERADSWMFNPVSKLDNSGQFYSWQHWCIEFGIPLEAYIPFNPGGNFILTRERVHRLSKEYYQKLFSTLPDTINPVEAHCCERTYYYLWR